MAVSEEFFDRLRVLLRPLDAPPAVPAGFRPAGVLVPLRAASGGEVHVVLARRTERVPHHKGQVCFPGGSREPQDADLLATALREAEEEVGLSPRGVSLLGTLEPVVTVTGFSIQPFVARIPATARFTVDPFEVAEVFEAPLSAFARLDRYRFADSLFMGAEHRVYFFDFGPHVIWGATARILRRLGELYSLLQPAIDNPRATSLK